MTLRPALLASAVAMFPMTVPAVTLDFPATSSATSEQVQTLGSYRVPTGPFADGALPAVRVNGEILKQAWRVGSGSLTTLQMIDPLRRQLEQAGFEILFECDTENCGGFDFRYGADLLPEPVMHVDLGDFRFLSARQGKERDEYISLMVSRSRGAGFVELTHVMPVDPEQQISLTSTKGPLVVGAPQTVPLGPLAETLERTGRYSLDDLKFDTGSSSLGQGTFASLAALADYLNANPKRTVALVGHTDAEGGLGGNIALSKMRAASVVERLVNAYAIPEAQLEAEGVGFLAPRASNLNDDGRARNRRVEVILTSIQ